ncbi:hypothetical protein TD95_005200 [Thielaviopsis punctulata]|uniref:Uncharacterized protein n=1 Tax=Thielaviopsis punctulata TaxID=72032 RepID=A0A0F4ZH47_9PEZI|nr:hypothetical protein TD95_005200 [Thielaviopsis punctulata]
MDAFTHYANQTPSGASSASAGTSSALRMPATPPTAPSSAASIEPFLRDFTLVAEAAKRAQMAILTRDMDGFSF